MSVLSPATQVEVESRLVSDGIISEDQLSQSRSEAEKSNTPLLTYLVHNKQIDDEQLAKVTAEVTNTLYVNLSNSKIDSEALSLLPQEIAERYMAIPLGEMQNRLVVAMLDADNIQAVDFLSNKIGRPLKVYAASESGIRQALKQYTLSLGDSMSDAFGNSESSTDVATGKPSKNSNIKTIVQDSPISKALSAILDYAAKNRASDIHIEPLEKELKIRCRIDGVLREIMKLPKSTEPPLVSRVKILSNLKIDEHRIPQDGQFTVHAAGKEIDLRIAISPVVWGEQIVIRLLDKSGTSLRLEDMGYAGRSLRTIRKGLENPNGMILTSGPTGSGKSTSLYALIKEIMTDEINIVTLEDPVEYKMSGVNQIQVNADVGLTFASGLRSILRQDPDVVMVGEIRDKETATLAVQAALTGHLVFSTLHTNSAAGILPRLLDMGIEPFLIASTVHTIIGQRLVRRIRQDDSGRETYTSNRSETEAIHETLSKYLPKNAAELDAVSHELGYKSLPLYNENAYTLFKGIDSPDTPGGYKGRMGLYEVMEVTETIQDLILKRAPSSEIQRAAQAEGMINMHEDGYLKALAGQTTLSEVNRVAGLDNS
ncbi:type II/IV secretion system protein [Candidatus Saccharibacteria bacterium]|nr:type II/IV secretion system protein [Candidatus Saccharibacteria bacterium]